MVTDPSATMARKLSTSGAGPPCAAPRFGSAPPRAKLTIRAPPDFRRPRRVREFIVSMTFSSRFRHAHHGIQNACVRPAAAQIGGQSLLHLVERRVRLL